jgi:hypothetical protein
VARKKRKGPSRFHSKAQWRWAFANKKEWAHRHARRTPGGKGARYRRLPKKSRKSRKR